MKKPPSLKLTPREIKLLEAAKKGDLKFVQKLLAAGVTADTRDSRSMPWDVTPLMYAAESGHLQVVRALLAAGASVTARDRHVPGEGGGRTPLHYAAARQQLEIMKALISAGADVNAVANRGTAGTPLLEAFSRRQPKMKSVADVLKFKAPPVGEEKSRILEAVRFLLSAGAEPNLVHPETGAGPLDRAADMGFVEAAECLLGADADPHHQDATGSTAFDTAAAKGRPDVAQLLLAKGLDFTQRDRSGWTHLMWAVAGRQPTLVSELLKAGAPTDELNSEGKTALDLAIANEDKESIAILEQVNSKRGAEKKGN
jgi:ankyrin repeat protein